jgi:site-specific recombinase XerD
LIAWLFPSPSAKGAHTLCVRKPFRRTAAAAELDPNRVVRHALRHPAIPHLVQAGLDVPTVKRISGHKTVIMVARYAHANGEHIPRPYKGLRDLEYPFHDRTITVTRCGASASAAARST